MVTFKFVWYSICGFLIGALLSWIVGGVAHLASAIFLLHWDFDQTQESIRYYGVGLACKAGCALTGMALAFFENSDQYNKEYPACPKCLSRRSEVVSRKKQYYETTRTETIRIDQHSPGGKTIGYSTMEYEVPDEDYRVEVTRKCNACDHKWSPGYSGGSGDGIISGAGVLLLFVASCSVVGIIALSQRTAPNHANVLATDARVRVATPIPMTPASALSFGHGDPRKLGQPSLPGKNAHLFSVVGVADNDTDGGLIVRKDPSSHAAKFGVLKPTTDDIEFLGEARLNGPTLWLLVKIGQDSGWAPAQYLIANGSPAQEQLDQAKASATPQREQPKQRPAAEIGSVALPMHNGVSLGIPVRGKPGFVRSPFASNSGPVNVSGFPPGTYVRCPYTGRTFEVP